MTELGSFAQTIFKRTYAIHPDETWDECARRVADFVAEDPKMADEFFEIIRDRKFMPGGRYLAQAGREVPQLTNCLAGDTRVLTKEGYRPIKEIVGSIDLVTMKSNGQTAWVPAKVRSFGHQQLWKLELSRHGVSKIIYTTKEHDWLIEPNTKVQTHHLNVGDKLTFRAAPKFKGHHSPIGLMHGLWFGDGTRRTSSNRRDCELTLCGDKNKELLYLFENFHIDYYDDKAIVRGGPNYFKDKPSINETYSYLLGWLSGYFAADGCVSKEGTIILSSCNRENLEFAKDVCGVLGIYTYGITQQERISNLTGEESTLFGLRLHAESLSKDFFQLSHHRDRFQRRASRPNRTFRHWKVVSVTPTEKIEEVFCASVPETHNFLLEDHILTGNCFLFRAEDSREGWAALLYKHMMALSTGGGCGTFYGDVRPSGLPIGRFGGVSSGPLALMSMVNEVARHVLAGGKRRSALWAGLPWDHKDIESFITAKDWTTAVKALKEQDFNFPAPLDMTNISVCLNDDFFKKVHKDQDVWNLYYRICKNMCKTGEPGFSIDLGKEAKNVLRNPCTEVVSDLDSDCCNLGSVNLSRITDIDELKRVTRLGVRFLYLGTYRSWVPHEDIAAVREKNRRIGLGLMGLHEWCIRNGERYEPSGELGKWLSCWANISDDEAKKFSKKMKGIQPVAVRAIAPTGTIGIIAETTTGIEPVYCVAYKRRYLNGAGKWDAEYVIDPTVKKLLEEGIIKDPDEIEDSMKLAGEVERRIRMQAFVQSFVDQAISSTINLPEWGEPGNNNATQFARFLLEYLPKLRGITCYPDKARAGQPIVPIKWQTAMKYQPEAKEDDERCKGGVCGI